MDPATSARIFEPFFTTKPEGAGTGLGLSSAYGAVTQNGGAMLVDSEPGAGATFRLLLPCAGERAPSAEVPVPASPARPTEATILLVDDDDPVRRLLRSALQREGYRVVDAPGPSQALAIWREVGEIALLVTDVVMPGMTGVRLYERLVEDGCSCRVIFISGYARSLGADAELVPSDAPFLEKPFGPRELLDAVRGSLEKGDATRGTGTVPA
jgi:CheY-like chemotaxis protein